MRFLWVLPGLCSPEGSAALSSEFLAVPSTSLHTADLAEQVSVGFVTVTPCSAFPRSLLSLAHRTGRRWEFKPQPREWLRGSSWPGRISAPGDAGQLLFLL